MTFDERNQLRSDVSAYFQSQQPAPAPVPLPPAANRAALTPVQQEVLFDDWVSHINSRPTQTWTADEKNAIRVASTRVLKELGF
jgi:hypothetical protein